MWPGGTLFVYAKLSGVGLNVCECAGKAERHFTIQVSSHTSLANVTFGLVGHAHSCASESMHNVAPF